MKNILITGCSSGIGYETALIFARNGHNVYASMRDINSAGAQKLKQIAKDEKLSIQLLKIDVTDEESINAAINDLKQSDKHIDVLVNNAGQLHLGPIEQFTVDEIKAQFEVNYFGTVRMIKAVVPDMRARKSGLIINVSSINGLIPFPLYGAYSATKFALETTTEILRFELNPFGVKVALVEPGSFKSKVWNNHHEAKSSNDPNSPYKKLCKFLETIDKRNSTHLGDFIENLTHPRRVALAIYRISEQSNPKLRNIVGIDAKLLYVARKILPESLQFYLLRKAYKW